jgi:hypothetical protein
LNYSDLDGLYPDHLLALFTSIPDTLRLSDIFDLSNPSFPDLYEFKGFIGFLGAHYLSFFR